MSAAVVLGCAVLGIVAGLFLNVLIDKVPTKQPLWPLRFRCPRCPGNEPDRPAPPDPDARAGLPEPHATADPSGPYETADLPEPNASARPPDQSATPDLSDANARADLAEPDEAAGVPDPNAAARLPIGAWLRPGGRCPVCGRRLSARYFLVPLANAALFAAAAVRFGAAWVLPAYLVFFAVLLTVSVIDLQLQIIPNRIVYPAIFVSIPLLTLAAAADHDWSRLRHALIGATLAWLALLVIHLVSPGGMGFGDVRLSFLLGLFLGWLGYGHVLTGLFLGFLLGAVVGLGLVVLRLRSRTDHVPFGPFLALGATVAVLVGDPIVKAWLG